MGSPPYFRGEYLVEWNGRELLAIESLRGRVHPTVFTLLKGEMAAKVKKGRYTRFRVYLLAEPCFPDPDTPLEGKSFYAMIKRKPKAATSWISCAYNMPNNEETLGEALWHSFSECARSHPDNDVAFGGFYGLEEGEDETTLRIYVTDTNAFIGVFQKWCKARIARAN